MDVPRSQHAPLPRSAGRRLPRPRRALPVAAWVALAAIAAAPTVARAQLIGLRSVPVASGDQFLVNGSARLGMADVTLALDDRLLDPFVNPAKASLLEGSAFLTAPTFYGISGDNGGARTLPLTALLSGRRWSGAVSVALQEVVDEQGPEQAIFFEGDAWFSPPQRLNESSSSNLFTQAVLARRLEGGDVSVGVSLAWASLSAVDGVDLLYAGNQGLDQDGELADVRIGVHAGRPEEERWEVVALWNRLHVTHEISSVVWLPVPADGEWPIDQPPFTVETRTERDETRTLGLHAAWTGARSPDGWRTGAALTVNRKDHPSIPNYDLQNIPRDPGETWAWNAAAGVSRVQGGVTVAADLVLEPIWSETWAEADVPVVRTHGGTIPAGGRTVDNDFFFTDVHLRVGAGWEHDRWGVQAGIKASRYAYDLDQVDHVAGTTRTQDEGWMEWTPTWGGSVTLSDVTIRYAGRVTTGTGRPGVEWAAWRAEAGALDSDVIIAPSGPLTLQEAHVWTHQVALSVPLR